MTENPKLEELTDNFKKYVTTSYELIKLEATERTSVVGSAIISNLLIGVAGTMFVLFLSLTAGFYLSSKIGDSYSGFAIVTGFYLIVAIILKVGKKKMVEMPLRDTIVRKVFSKN